jgi:hypothetical protein
MKKGVVNDQVNVMTCVASRYVLLTLCDDEELVSLIFLAIVMN